VLDKYEIYRNLSLSSLIFIHLDYFSFGMEDISIQIVKLCQMSLEDASKDSRVSGFSLDVLKKMAKHLSLSSSQSRIELVKAVRRKYADVQRLKEIVNTASLESSDSEDENPIVENDYDDVNVAAAAADDNNNDSVVDESDYTQYRKDKNTIPRLINILFEHPDAVARSHMLASRIQLQNKETYDKQQIFVESMNKFNDRQYNSGGLVTEHEVFTERNIDPEKVGQGTYSSKKAWKHFKKVRKDYAAALVKYEASGQHENHDFYRYCKSDADVLYLFLSLKRAGNPEISAFMQEGSEIRGGLDTAMRMNTSRSSESSSISSRKSSNKESQGLLREIIAGQNRKRELDTEEAVVLNRAYGAIERESLTKALSSLSCEIDKLMDDIGLIEESASSTASEKLLSKKRRLDDANKLYNQTKDKLDMLD
jgi:hypothetical protein